MCSPNSNNATSDEIVRSSKLQAVVRGVLGPLLVVREAVAESPRLRLFRDIDHATDTDLDDLNGQLTMPRDAADRGSPNTDRQGAVTETRSPEVAPLLSDGSRRPPTSGTFSADRLTAIDIRLTLSTDPQPVDPTLRGGALPEPAAVTRAGDLVPQLRWLLTDSAGTIANVAHQLETRGAEVDDDARARLYDDVSVLDEELATVRALLGNCVDWDAEAKRLLDGEIPPLAGDEAQDDESFG
jgi:hypothetical protein